MSLILVATVGGVLLERFSSVARRTDAWGYAGAEPGTRPATVRGPPTAVFSRPSCQITEGQFMARLTTEQGLLHHAAPHRAVGTRPGPRRAVLGLALTALGAKPHQSWEHGRSWRKDAVYVVVEQSPALAGDQHERRAPGLNHLAFRAGTAAELDTLVAAAPPYGWRLLFADRHPWAGGPEH